MSPLVSRGVRVVGAAVLAAVVGACILALGFPERFGGSRRTLIGASTYLSLLAGGLVGAGIWTSRRAQGFRRGVTAGLAWGAAWHGWVGLLVLGGALLGAVLFPLGALVFGVERSLTELVLAGLRDGGFYLFIWAPGVGFVLCVIEAHGRLKKRRAAERDLDNAY